MREAGPCGAIRQVGLRLTNGSDFYDCLIERLQPQWETVTLDFYSISACFGFYSKGMRVFAKVLDAMWQALQTPHPFKVNRIRVLLYSDDGPIDNFGVERFHEYLEPAGLELRRLEKPALHEDWVQFALFNDTALLITRPQSGLADKALGLGINRLAPATQVTRESNPDDVAKAVERFRGAWEASSRFDFPRIPTVTQLQKVLTTAFPIERSADFREVDYEKQLFALLHGVCDRQLIRRQFTIGSHRLDFVLGDPSYRLIAIEVKVATDDESELNRLRGQIDTYRKVVKDILVVLIGNGISAQKLGTLERDYSTDENVTILHLR